MSIASPLNQLSRRPEVLIEQPRWSVVKRRSDGNVDFVSPLPCPYNYGCIPAVTSGDGDPLDAVVLGPRLPRGLRLQVPVVAVVDFVDEDQPDPKVICSVVGLSGADRLGLLAFFTAYARFKGALALARGRKGAVHSRGFLPDAAWRR